MRLHIGLLNVKFFFIIFLLLLIIFINCHFFSLIFIFFIFVISFLRNILIFLALKVVDFFLVLFLVTRYYVINELKTVRRVFVKKFTFLDVRWWYFKIYSEVFNIPINVLWSCHLWCFIILFLKFHLFILFIVFKEIRFFYLLCDPCRFNSFLNHFFVIVINQYLLLYILLQNLALLTLLFPFLSGYFVRDTLKQMFVYIDCGIFHCFITLLFLL